MFLPTFQNGYYAYLMCAKPVNHNVVTQLS